MTDRRIVRSERAKSVHIKEKRLPVIITQKDSVCYRKNGHFQTAARFSAFGFNAQQAVDVHCFFDASLQASKSAVAFFKNHGA